MTCKAYLRTAFPALSLALLSAVTSAVTFAQDAAQNTASRLDADLDNDGIMDAVEALTSLKSETAIEKTSSDVQLKQKISGLFQPLRRVRPPSKHNTCGDYLLMSPEKRMQVDQKVQARTLGVFGTRPCDPIVSPLLERPFDTDFIEVPLLPNASIILHDSSRD